MRKWIPNCHGDVIKKITEESWKNENKEAN